MLQSEVNKIKYIAEEIADIPFGSIDGKNRQRNISLARQVVGAFMICDLGLTKAKAANLMNRDRTSFHFYEKKHYEYMQDKRIYPEYNELYEKVSVRYLNDNDSVYSSKNTIGWLEQLDRLKDQQKQIQREMKALERESKLLGL